MAASLLANLIVAVEQRSFLIFAVYSVAELLNKALIMTSDGFFGRLAKSSSNAILNAAIASVSQVATSDVVVAAMTQL